MGLYFVFFATVKAQRIHFSCSSNDVSHVRCLLDRAGSYKLLCIQKRAWKFLDWCEQDFKLCPYKHGSIHRGTVESPLQWLNCETSVLLCTCKLKAPLLKRQTDLIVRTYRGKITSIFGLELTVASWHISLSHQLASVGGRCSSGLWLFSLPVDISRYSLPGRHSHCGSKLET